MPSASFTHLSNPYFSNGVEWDELSKVTGRVAPQDLALIKRLSGYRLGSIDKITSTLFHALCTELRNLAIDSTAWDERILLNETIIADVLARIQFVPRPPECGLQGGAAGNASSDPGEELSPQPLAGPTPSLHPKVLPSPNLRTVTEAGSD